MWQSRFNADHSFSELSQLEPAPSNATQERRPADVPGAAPSVSTVVPAGGPPGIEPPVTGISSVGGHSGVGSVAEEVSI